MTNQQGWCWTGNTAMPEQQYFVQYASRRAVDISKAVGEVSEKYSRTFGRTNWVNQDISRLG